MRARQAAGCQQASWQQLMSGLTVGSSITDALSGHFREWRYLPGMSFLFSHHSSPESDSKRPPYPLQRCGR